MRSSKLVKVALVSVSILLLFALVKSCWYIYQYQLLDRWRFNIGHALQDKPSGKLDSYRPVIQAKKVDGNGLSSLTYNTDTGTLFTLGDDTPRSAPCSPTPS